MKKLLALLGSLLMVGGSATTVVACGTRVYDRVNISGINTKLPLVWLNDDFEKLKLDIAAEIRTISQDAAIDVDYTIKGNTTESGKGRIIVESMSSSKLLEGSFKLDVLGDKIPISDIKINDIKVKDTKAWVEHRISDEITVKFGDAQLGYDYIIEGLDDLLVGDQVNMTGFVSVIAIGQWLIGGFLLQINENGSITTPFPPTDPTEPTDPKPEDRVNISDLQGKIININSMSTIQDAIAEVKKQIKTKSKWAVFGRDYTIAGNPQKDKVLQVKTTLTSKWITGSFTIDVKQIYDISKINITGAQVGHSIDAINGTIRDAIQALYSDAEMNKDYEVHGLENLLKDNEDQIIDMEGFVGVKSIEDNLTGAFLLQINENGSITKPIVPPTKPTDPNFKKQDISQLQGKITGINKDTTKEELNDQIYSKIRRLVEPEDAIFGWDYTIGGSPKNDKIIKVDAIDPSDLIFGSFTIDVERDIEDIIHISTIKEELQQILAEKEHATWTQSELQNEVDTKYGVGEITVQEIETSSRAWDEQHHKQDWKFIGNGLITNSYKYNGDVTLTHEWKETIDKTEDISTIQTALEEILKSRPAQAWTESELQTEVNTKYPLGGISVKKGGSSRASHPQSHNDPYIFSGDGNISNEHQYKGSITLTHSWTETIDDTINISTITTDLQAILNKRPTQAWTQSELQNEVDTKYNVGEITVQKIDTLTRASGVENRV
ncbi:lipoprotein, partial [Williamsoniiplasma luminosum]